MRVEFDEKNNIRAIIPGSEIRRFKKEELFSSLFAENLSESNHVFVNMFFNCIVNIIHLPIDEFSYNVLEPKIYCKQNDVGDVVMVASADIKNAFTTNGYYQTDLDLGGILFATKMAIARKNQELENRLKEKESKTIEDIAEIIEKEDYPEYSDEENNEEEYDDSSYLQFAFRASSFKISDFIAFSKVFKQNIDPLNFEYYKLFKDDYSGELFINILSDNNILPLYFYEYLQVKAYPRELIGITEHISEVCRIKDLVQF